MLHRPGLLACKNPSAVHPSKRPSVRRCLFPRPPPRICRYNRKVGPKASLTRDRLAGLPTFHVNEASMRWEQASKKLVCAGSKTLLYTVMSPQLIVASTTKS